MLSPGVGLYASLGLERRPIMRASLTERYEFLRFAMGIGKEHVIIGQILFDLEDALLERVGPDEELDVPLLFPEEEKRRLALLRLRRALAPHFEIHRIGLPVSPREVADILEAFVSEEIPA